MNWQKLYKDGLGFSCRCDYRGQTASRIEVDRNVTPVHHKILLTYLRMTNIKLGLLINFHEELLKNGIKRVVNNL